MTKELFLEDAYQRECKAQIIKKDGNAVILDQTVFYPTGGGQEHDKGVLVQGDNVFRVIEKK